jgi:antitoxin (DNA-binding transcriptional repressor) of toxin-antitoxin stability system
MSTVSLEDAQADLRQVIAALNPGEPLIITENGEAVATLIRSGGKRWPAKAGSAKDTDHWMAPDFDAPLEEFEEYMRE